MNTPGLLNWRRKRISPFMPTAIAIKSSWLNTSLLLKMFLPLIMKLNSYIKDNIFLLGNLFLQLCVKVLIFHVVVCKGGYNEKEKERENITNR